MQVQLPPRLYRARTVRTESLSRVRVRMELGRGVSAETVVRIEGLSDDLATRKNYDEAKHCLIVLLGGKNLVVMLNDDNTSAAEVTGRVFLCEKVYGEPPGMVQPYGLTDELLDVADFVRTLAPDWNVGKVKAVLNGRRPNG